MQPRDFVDTAENAMDTWDGASIRIRGDEEYLSELTEISSFTSRLHDCLEKELAYHQLVADLYKKKPEQQGFCEQFIQEALDILYPSLDKDNTSDTTTCIKLLILRIAGMDPEAYHPLLPDMKGVMKRVKVGSYIHYRLEQLDFNSMPLQFEAWQELPGNKKIAKNTVWDISDYESNNEKYYDQRTVHKMQHICPYNCSYTMSIATSDPENFLPPGQMLENVRSGSWAILKQHQDIRQARGNGNLDEVVFRCRGAQLPDKEYVTATLALYEDIIAGKVKTDR